MSSLPTLSLTCVDTLMDSYTSVDIMTDMGGLLPVGQSHSGPGSDSLVCLLHMFMFFMERVTSTGIMIGRRWQGWCVTCQPVTSQPRVGMSCLRGLSLTLSPRRSVLTWSLVLVPCSCWFAGQCSCSLGYFLFCFVVWLVVVWGVVIGLCMCSILRMLYFLY